MRRGDRACRHRRASPATGLLGHFGVDALRCFEPGGLFGEETVGSRTIRNALEEIRVGLSEFNGHDVLNIRIWAEPRNGGAERIPTKAGICCNVRLLPELIEALRQAEAAARKAGLL